MMLAMKGWDMKILAGLTSLFFINSVALHFDSRSFWLGCRKVAALSTLSVSLAMPSIAIDSDSIIRMEKAQATLTNLDNNWEKIVQGQGDNIRRKLGTVYTPPTCESPLCGFPQFVNRFVQNNYDELDIPAFEEPMGQFLEAINQADYLAYSSIFSEVF